MLLEPESWCFPFFFCKMIPTLSLLFLFHGSFLRGGRSNRGGNSSGPVLRRDLRGLPATLPSSSVVPTFNFPSMVPSISTPPDVPIKVEYLSDPISVPSPLFHLQGYSASISTSSSSSISTSHIPNVTNSPALAYPSN